MATVDKNFKVKHGLIVEGTTATVNGEDILTTASTTSNLGEGTNLYFTDQRAIDAVSSSVSTAVSTAIEAIDTDAIEEGLNNLYFTTSRFGDALGSSVGTGLSFDSVTKGISVTANTYDAFGAASSAQTAAQSYADGLAVNYDAAGSSSAAQSAAQSYADGLASNYDAAGAAATAESNANAYTDTAVSNLVNGAPALLDTLNELAAAINDDASFATTVATQIGEKQNTLTAGSNIDITADTISVTGLDSADISDFNTAALSATASAYDAAGAAATAEQNAKDYADLNFVTLTDLPGQLDDYVPVTEKGAALGVATLDASGYVPASQLNIDVSGDITTAINALTTDDIEEGSTNLYFTDSRAVDALEAVTPNFTEVDVNSVAKQIAATATISAGATSDSAMAYGWVKNSYTSAKFLVKVIATSSGESEMSEVLVSVDPSDNVHITEYGILSTNGALSTIGAERMGGIVMLTVSPTYNSTVKVFGTLLP